MSWADEDLADLARRAERAVGGVNLAQLFTRWRRVVGPPPEQMSDLARGAYDAVRQGVAPTAEQRQALERAIRLLRPAPLVRSGSLGALDRDTAPAFPDWPNFRATVNPYLGSVGRIDHAARRRGQASVPVATGFLIAEGRLVTNDHVVDELTLNTGALVPRQAEVRFGQEHGPAHEPDPIPIEAVVARDPDLDLAVLAIAPRWDPGVTIRLIHVALDIGTPVAAVGYPMRGGCDPDIVSGLFGGVLGVKRVSPGEVIARRDAVMSHDCTTLGGSSGSPLFTLVGAHLAGVHNDGMYLARNHATCGEQMHQFLREHVR